MLVWKMLNKSEVFTFPYRRVVNSQNITYCFYCQKVMTNEVHADRFQMPINFLCGHKRKHFARTMKTLCISQQFHKNVVGLGSNNCPTQKTAETIRAALDHYCFP